VDVLPSKSLLKEVVSKLHALLAFDSNIRYIAAVENLEDSKVDLGIIDSVRILCNDEEGLIVFVDLSQKLVKSSLDLRVSVSVVST
jgi:hypothetical protein